MPDVAYKPIENVKQVEDLISKPPEYVKTWTEYASENYEQIYRNGTRTGGGNGVLYVVPKGKILYITNLSLVATYDGITSQNTSFLVWKDNLATIILSFTFNGIAGIPEITSFSTNLSMPLKIDANNVLSFGVGGVGVNFNVIMFGFLVPIDPKKQ